MQHAPITGQPTEKPFEAYVADAEAQIAHTRATSTMLHGIRSRDAELARAIAVLDRAADRSKVTA